MYRATAVSGTSLWVSSPNPTDAVHFIQRPLHSASVGHNFVNWVAIPIQAARFTAPISTKPSRHDQPFLQWHYPHHSFANAIRKNLLATTIQKLWQTIQQQFKVIHPASRKRPDFTAIKKTGAQIASVDVLQYSNLQNHSDQKRRLGKQSLVIMIAPPALLPTCIPYQ